MSEEILKVLQTLRKELDLNIALLQSADKSDKNKCFKLEGKIEGLEMALKLIEENI